LTISLRSATLKIMACGGKIGSFPCCSVINDDCHVFTNEMLFSGEFPADGVIITDPPYGISHPCDFHTRGRDALAACKDYADVAGDTEPFDPTHILSLSVPTVLWGANHFSDKVPGSSGWLVWDKERPATLDQATCELAWTNFIKGVRILNHRWNGMLRDDDDTLLHPTQKPVHLTTWILNSCATNHNWTPTGAVVDLYSGSGAALVAAKRAGRHYLGFELSKEYCEIAERWLLNPTSCQGDFNKKGNESQPNLFEGD